MKSSDLASRLNLHACDCPKCGYNLYATIQANRSKCPECGGTYRLQVSPTHRGAGAWYVIVVAASMLLGGSSLYLAYVFVRGYRDHLSDLEVNAMLLMAPLSLLTVVLLGVGRERMIRRPFVAAWFASSAGTLLVLSFLSWWVGWLPVF